MNKIKNKDFTGKTVDLDGNSYEDCKFNNAKLTYSGGEPPELIRCDCSGATIGFRGAAERTAMFMRAMAQDPALSGYIRHVFAEVLPR